VTNTALLTLASNYVKDLSTLNFATTASSGVSIQRFNPFGNTQTYAISSATVWGSTYFGGSGNYMTTNSNPALTPIATTQSTFTIEAWIYMTAASVGTFGAVVGDMQATSTNDNWSFGPNASGQLAFYWYDGAGHTLTGNTVMNTNTWYHIAVSVNAAAISMYVNGVSQTITGNTPLTNRTANNNSLSIGQYSNGSGLFTGYISNLRIVNGTAVYTATFTPSPVPLAPITNTVLLTNQYSNSVADVSTASNVISATGVAVPSLRTPFARVDTSTAATIYSGSVYFGGSGNYMTTNSTPISTTQTTFTVEAWIYMTATSVGSDRGAVVGDMQATAGSNVWSFGPNASGQLTFYWYTGSLNTAYGNTILNLNTWYHIAVSINATAISMYVNGVQQTLTGTTTLTNRLGSNNSLAIGQYSNGSSLFTGYISNLRIVNGQALYTTTFTLSTVPLTTSSQGATGTVLLIPGINAGIYDSTMENNVITTATAQLSTAQYEFGGGSILLNGTTDYLLTPFAPRFVFSGNFTIEAWFNATALPATNSQKWLISSYNAGGNARSFALVLGNTSGTANLGFFFNPDGTSGSNINLTVPTGTINTSTWYHVAASRSAGTIQLFLNGVSIGSTATSITNYNNASGFVAVGSDYPGLTAAYFFQGYIDDIRITNGIARYTATFTPPSRAFQDIQLVSSNIVSPTFTTATNIGTVTWGYNTATTRWSGLQEPTASSNLTPMNIEDQANTATGYFSLPTGTTGQRPVNPQAGYMRYNTTLDSVEYYNFVTGWTTIP